jgi:hypothetical protein
VATDSRNIVYLQTTDAEFRTWVAAIIDQLTDIGLTQTSDTGQIDTATVAKPAGVATIQGYAVFRFNDSLQGTAPIYLKFEFGSGAASAALPIMWLTTGSGTDGAGTITGTTYRARTNISFTTATSTAWPANACYNATYGIFWANWLNAQSSTGGVVVCVMRGCDPDTGIPNAEGVATACASGTASWRWWDIALAVAETSPSLAILPYSVASSEPLAMHDGRIIASACMSGYDSGSVFSFPGVLALHGLNMPPYMLCYATPFTTEICYIALTNGGSIYNTAINGNNYDKPLMIWQ